LEACVNERKRVGSACADRCLSRLACPVASEHRYGAEQMKYHYAHSLQAIRRFS
jgi:hypothetical protein